MPDKMLTETYEYGTLVFPVIRLPFHAETKLAVWIFTSGAGREHSSFTDHLQIKNRLGSEGWFVATGRYFNDSDGIQQFTKLLNEFYAADFPITDDLRAKVPSGFRNTSAIRCDGYHYHDLHRRWALRGSPAASSTNHLPDEHPDEPLPTG
jgi:hypothetical protein